VLQNISVADIAELRAVANPPVCVKHVVHTLLALMNGWHTDIPSNFEEPDAKRWYYNEKQDIHDEEAVDRAWQVFRLIIMDNHIVQTIKRFQLKM